MKNASAIGAAVALALAVGGCATKYQDMGFTGGVAAEQVTADVFRIKSRGNAYTAQTTIQDYVLLKAAETAKSAGATHFMMISAADATTVDQIVTPGSANTSFVGRTAITTYTPATSTPVVKPGQDAYVRLVRLVPGQQPPAGAISADEIITFIGRRVERST
jgi:hypothetical protein